MTPASHVGAGVFRCASLRKQARTSTPGASGSISITFCEVSEKASPRRRSISSISGAPPSSLFLPALRPRSETRAAHGRDPTGSSRCRARSCPCRGDGPWTHRTTGRTQGTIAHRSTSVERTSGRHDGAPGPGAGRYSPGGLDSHRAYPPEDKLLGAVPHERTCLPRVS